MNIDSIRTSFPRPHGPRPLASAFGIVGLSVLAALPTDASQHQGKGSPVTKEFEEAIQLTPNLENGRKLYRVCVTCHGPEAWGTRDGAYPQIAGQLRSVIIKQLADIRAGNRSNPIMRAFTSTRALPGPQAIADVAGYIAQLPMTRHNGEGPSFDLDRGKQLYNDNCTDCHGANGEGDSDKHIPLLYGQHYQYLFRQFEHIRHGMRRNADPDMVEQIKGFRLRDQVDVLTYTSKLKPPKEKLAPPGWTNPDFPYYRRSWHPSLP